jgi:hypothetical protein
VSGGAGARGGDGAAEPRAETATWVGQHACVGRAPSGDGGRQARRHIGGQSWCSGCRAERADAQGIGRRRLTGRRRKRHGKRESVGLGVFLARKFHKWVGYSLLGNHSAPLPLNQIK